MPRAKSYKIFNAWHLKLMMATLMFLDHFRHISGIIPDEWQLPLSIITRCVAPVFAFLAVESILHTRSIEKYCLRLWLFAIAMFMGNAIIYAATNDNGRGGVSTGRVIFSLIVLAVAVVLLQWAKFRNKSAMGLICCVAVVISIFNPLEGWAAFGYNVIFTLAAGVTSIAMIDQSKSQNKNTKGLIRFAAVVLSVFAGIWGEWGSVIIPFMYVTYYLRNKIAWKYIGYGVIEAGALLIPWGEPFWFISLPFITLYNGSRGVSNTFSKYFFYVFYPVHIWLLAVINFIR